MAAIVYCMAYASSVKNLTFSGNFCHRRVKLDREGNGEAETGAWLRLGPAVMLGRNDHLGGFCNFL
jgi:hypothetical protein